MKKILYNKYDKTRLAELPAVRFDGKIVIILTEQEAEKAVRYLLSQPSVGVDTETRPSFRKGDIHLVSLLQVSTHNICFLFRLNRIGLCKPVIELLENQRVPMIGLSWHDDLMSLHRRGAFSPGLFIDLQKEVEKLGIEDQSLQKLYANIFGEKISKSQRLTNWDADVLNIKQKM
jgi:ribonuclease D